MNTISSNIQALTNFFVPKAGRYTVDTTLNPNADLVAVIPTYKPSHLTLKLVSDLIAWNKNLRVIVVNDNAPKVEPFQSMLAQIQQLADKLPSKITLIHTPHNLYKPGALNFGLDHISAKNMNPDVIITFDDDVKIEQDTISLISKRLLQSEKLGAVSSLVRVSNKNKNLLTRLQGLEYHNFNITKIADNGFYQGPLVMQGMLVAFKYAALVQAGGFSTGHLIEDYHLTAKLKKLGWIVAIEPKAVAWTDVPENVINLWIQRARWMYGGLGVMKEFWQHRPSIIQDLIGHALFISTALVVSLSFMLPYNPVNDRILFALLIVAVTQFFFGYAYNLYLTVDYRDADFWDYAIKALIIPEFIYAIYLSTVLATSYSFYIYNDVIGRFVINKNIFGRIYLVGVSVFKKIGFSSTWTRYSTQIHKGGGTINA